MLVSTIDTSLPATSDITQSITLDSQLPNQITFTGTQFGAFVFGESIFGYHLNCDPVLISSEIITLNSVISEIKSSISIISECEL